MAKVALVQYTGKSQQFNDHLRRGSGRIWNGPGTVLQIPDNEKFVYLAHASLFREVTREQFEAEQATKDTALDTIKQAVVSLSLTDLKAALKVVQDEISLKAAQVPAVAPVVPVKESLTAAEVAQSGDVATMQAYNERIQRVVTAIRGMDLKDDSIARNGRPTPEGVRDHMGGQLPTEDEITMAMQLIDGVIEETQDDEAKAKAQAALAELAAADRATMLEMVKVFGVQAHHKLGDEKLREKLREHLEAA